jgi:hypothetical protein
MLYLPLPHPFMPYGVLLHYTITSVGSKKFKESHILIHNSYGGLGGERYPPTPTLTPYNQKTKIKQTLDTKQTDKH